MEGGWIIVYPPSPDSQAALNKFYVAGTGSRDNGPGVPDPISSRTTRKLAQANRDGKQVTVSAEVHEDEKSSDEDEDGQIVSATKPPTRMEQGTDNMLLEYLRVRSHMSSRQ